MEDIKRDLEEIQTKAAEELSQISENGQEVAAKEVLAFIMGMKVAQLTSLRKSA